MILPVLLDGARELPPALKHTQAIRAYGDKLGWELQVVGHIRAYILLQLRLIENVLVEEQGKSREQSQENHDGQWASSQDIKAPAVPKPSIGRTLLSDVATVPNALKVGAGLAVFLVGILGGSGGKN